LRGDLNFKLEECSLSGVVHGSKSCATSFDFVFGVPETPFLLFESFSKIVLDKVERGMPAHHEYSNSCYQSVLGTTGIVEDGSCMNHMMHDKKP
jgi:hypothetical protein